MIVSNLTGGLGNQMFQYAFGRTIAIKNRTLLVLHHTNALFNTQYLYGLKVFKIKARIAKNNDLASLGVIGNRVINRLLYLFDERFNIQLNKNIITQKYPYNFDLNYLKIKNHSYIQGFWADSRYFNGIEKELRTEFKLHEKFDPKNQEILDLINKTNSVSVHVRRGDLVSSNRNDSFIGINYYIKSIKFLKSKVKDPYYFVFSDDITWCKINLSPLLKKVIYVCNNSGDKSYKDLLIMSKCDHNIIANSTFSWWAAWLNENPIKIIIRPKSSILVENSISF